MTAATWYFVKDESVNGPIDRLTLMEHTFTGLVEPETLVWSEWDDRPRPLHAIPEFSSFLSAAAISASSDAFISFAAPLRARLVGASWILLGGLTLVMLMVLAFLMASSTGVSPWRGPALILGAVGALFLVREGHLTLKGSREALLTAGIATVLSGSAGLVCSLTTASFGGFGGLSILAILLILSGTMALSVDRAYRHWYGTRRA